MLNIVTIDKAIAFARVRQWTNNGRGKEDKWYEGKN